MLKYNFIGFAIEKSSGILELFFVKMAGVAGPGGQLSW
jgi:hypothetical protein